MINLLETEKIKNEAKIAVVLALPRELAGAKIIFADEDKLEDLGVQFGFTAYVCEIPSHSNDSDSHTVVLAVPPKTGNNHSAICVAQLVNGFPELEHIVLCGIAGGVPTPDNGERDVHLGDIVVANKDGIFQHDFGHDLYPPSNKHLLDKPQNPYIPSEEFDNINNYLITDIDLGVAPWIDRLNERLPILVSKNQKFTRPLPTSRNYYDKTNGSDLERIERNPPYQDPKVFSGGIASGNCVLKNPFRRDKLRDHHKILAVEMEAAGLAAACRQMRIDFTVVRGICDYCDRNKNDEWQYYAAATAAAYTFCVVSRIPSKPLRTRKSGSHLQTDFRSIERIGMQSATPGQARASSDTGIDVILPEKSPSITEKKESNATELELQNLLQEISRASTTHNWSEAYQHAVSLEELADSQADGISREFLAECLYRVAQVYSVCSKIEKFAEENNLQSRAQQLVKRAREVLG